MTVGRKILDESLLAFIDEDSLISRLGYPRVSDDAGKMDSLFPYLEYFISRD
jgi:hypothetical protein